MRQYTSIAILPVFTGQQKNRSRLEKHSIRETVNTCKKDEGKQIVRLWKIHETVAVLLWRNGEMANIEHIRYLTYVMIILFQHFLNHVQIKNFSIVWNQIMEFANCDKIEERESHMNGKKISRIPKHKKYNSIYSKRLRSRIRKTTKDKGN